MKQKLPKISVITPSYNQARFIEQTIQSVIDQNYPDLEFLVIDGGSNDGTLEILKKYKSLLTWVSEPDFGQSHAINKGFKKATGDVVTFLNSDDLYEPETLHSVGHYFAAHPEAMWLSGKCINIDENGKEIRQRIRLYKNFWLRLNNFSILKILNYISQPSTFWRRSALNKIGYLNDQLYYTMDYDYWLRLGQHYPLHVLYKDLSRFRIHSSSKSGTTTFRQFDEELKVVQQYYTGFPVFLHRLHRAFVIKMYERKFE